MEETDDDFEMIDVCDDVGTPVVRPQPTTCRTVYVPLRVYARELLLGQETAALARVQLATDAPRCHLEVEGRVFPAALLESVPAALVRFCTQSVLAPALELCARETLLAEARPPSRMEVSVRGDRVCVSKRMRTLGGGTPCPVRINVSASLQRPMVRIAYDFGPAGPVSDALDQF